jgi:acyl-CoA reductase-like NAD-dependent aldehyde dehydrogenase
MSSPGGVGATVPRFIDSLNPRTQSVIGRVPVLGPDEVRAAVDDARAEAVGWAALTFRARRDHLLAVRRSLVARGDELADILSAETGKPLSDAWIEIAAGCVMITYAAKMASRVLRTRRVSSWPIVAKRATLRYEPYGVIGAIVPWNFPVVISMQMIPFALAAGNTMVLKPSELAPLTGVLLGQIVADAGKDLVRVVTGDGSTGDALVRSGIDKLAFTGSGATARKILATAAETLTPVVMELGGKDPMIVCADADVRLAARTVAASSFINAGQTCMATERVFVVDSVYDEFVVDLLAEVGRLRLGNDGRAHVGSMTRPDQIAVIEDRLAAAVAAGARVAAGGGRRPDIGPSFFEPTVVLDVTPDMELMREESFAPVVSVMRVPGLADAVAQANRSEYGLNASVFTADRDRGRRVAEDLVAGGVNVNDALFGSAVPALPFGGAGQSGYGRLQGPEGLREFSRSKAIVEPRFSGQPGLAASLLTGRKVNPRVVRRLVRLTYGH